MRVYVDSSALLKRVLAEAESDALGLLLAGHADRGSALVCSSLGWIEVARALRARAADSDDGSVDGWCDTALSGVLERPIDAEVVALARRLGPPALRSLDAVHLASALLTDTDVLVAYDRRLLDAAVHHGLSTASPGAPGQG